MSTVPTIQSVIHAVRLTDNKIICLHKSNSAGIIGNEPFNERAQAGRLIMEGNNVGSIPTSLTCRIEDFYELSGFSFDMLLCVDSPRSPGDFGFEYTKQKFIEYGAVLSDSIFGQIAFQNFQREKW